MSLAEVAEKAGLSPSLLSRLVSEKADTRRTIQPDQVMAIARALEMAPGELLVTLDAAEMMGQWVERESLDAEADARLRAQEEAARTRTDLQAVIAQRDVLQRSLKASQARVEHLTKEVNRVQAELAESQAEAAQASGAATAAIHERDTALEQAGDFYKRLLEARDKLLTLDKQAREAKTVAWLATGVGAAAALLSASADRAPASRARKKK